MLFHGEKDEYIAVVIYGSDASLNKAALFSVMGSSKKVLL
jgi:hypothetical protein